MSGVSPAKRTRGKRSKFEARVGEALGAGWDYEREKLPYTLANNYIPDYSRRRDANAGGTIVEAKGRFTGPDRRKMLAVKAAHPNWDIRLVFMRNNPLYAGAASRYLDWAAKHGFPATVFPELPVKASHKARRAKPAQRGCR